MSRGIAVEVQFWGSDLCLASVSRDGNITNGSGVEWWDLSHPRSMHIVAREQVLLRWSLVTAEISRVKDRQKNAIEKGGAVMRSLFWRCCKRDWNMRESWSIGQCWREGWRATSSSGEYEPRCSALWISAQDLMIRSSLQLRLGKKKKTIGGCIYEKTECAKTYSWDGLPGLCVKRLDALACVRVELWHFVWGKIRIFFLVEKIIRKIIFCARADKSYYHTSWTSSY